MKIGDKVIRVPLTFADIDIDEFGRRLKRSYEGRVIYIHPKGRFHVVEFALAGGKVRESFRGCGA